MAIKIGLIVLLLLWVWIGYEIIYSPLVEDEEDIDPDNEFDNIF
ncbi:hypothetical protein UFOVP19_50 [uncultured Caudovirales phage]|uniref:Uncharacterized protein n=1 Tax=uncultured Caudovirales phage TaxID=2100421 RepID=A0A6J5KML3_9CAUD|nr:hypothetical protein UFOVP19_50 [uncultured Caudovirales phage]